MQKISILVRLNYRSIRADLSRTVRIDRYTFDRLNTLYFSDAEQMLLQTFRSVV